MSESGPSCTPPAQLLKSLSSRTQSLVMTAEEVETSLKAALTPGKGKKMYTRERLLQIARMTDTSRLPVDLEVARLRDLQDAAVYNQRPAAGGQAQGYGGQYQQQQGYGTGSGAGVANGIGGVGARSWIPNKDAPVFKPPQRTQSASQNFWGGGGDSSSQWTSNYTAYNQQPPTTTPTTTTRPVNQPAINQSEQQRRNIMYATQPNRVQVQPNGTAIQHPPRQPPTTMYNNPSQQRPAIMFPQSRSQQLPMQQQRPAYQQQPQRVQAHQVPQVVRNPNANLHAQVQRGGGGASRGVAGVASSSQKSMDIATLLGHMKGSANGQGQSAHISFEDLLNAAKAQGGHSGSVIGGKTVEEIERNMVNMPNKGGGSAQYLLSLLHAASGGSSSAQNASSGDAGRDINSIMEALFQKAPQQQQSSSKQGTAVSAKELERKNIAIAQQHQQSNTNSVQASLDALLNKGPQQSQRPQAQQTASQLPQNGQNNLDVLLKILQGQAQNQNPPQPAAPQPSPQAKLPAQPSTVAQPQPTAALAPNLQQLMMQQQLQQQMVQTMNSSSAAAMRPGNVVTGQRPPFGNVRGQQQTPNFLSSSTGGNYMAGGRVTGTSPRVTPRTSGSNPIAVAPTPPRSISGGGDSDVLQKLLKISKTGNGSGPVQQQSQQQRARVVEG
eukprot:TRINITY_DN4322_c0_g2_i1.p1 TRINITY_DN4322_c0_g2~~TRINITY_DN4322_c0_g2_i1.p1  ORF type:complete len:666 (+),score=118.37 TRINITY_DN4322_c0_g2_i1:263-2260(+)